MVPTEVQKDPALSFKVIALLIILLLCTSPFFAKAQEEEQEQVQEQETEYEEESEPETTGEYKTLNTRYYGEVVFGATVTQAQADVGGEFIEDGEEINGCVDGYFPKYPGISFLVRDGVIVSASTEDPQISTLAGVTVGSSSEDVFSQFPDAVMENHQYGEGQHYITYSSKDGNFGMRFEEKDGSVTSMSAGFLEDVKLVEGCM